MPDDPTDRDYIGECALHQNREGVSINVYEGLSDEDRIALQRDARIPDQRTPSQGERAVELELGAFLLLNLGLEGGLRQVALRVERQLFQGQVRV